MYNMIIILYHTHIYTIYSPTPARTRKERMPKYGMRRWWWRGRRGDEQGRHEDKAVLVHRRWCKRGWHAPVRGTTSARWGTRARGARDEAHAWWSSDGGRRVEPVMMRTTTTDLDQIWVRARGRQWRFQIWASRMDGRGASQVTNGDNESGARAWRRWGAAVVRWLGQRTREMMEGEKKRRYIGGTLVLGEATARD